MIGGSSGPAETGPGAPGRRRRRRARASRPTVRAAARARSFQGSDRESDVADRRIVGADALGRRLEVVAGRGAARRTCAIAATGLGVAITARSAVATPGTMTGRPGPEPAGMPLGAALIVGRCRLTPTARAAAGTVERGEGDAAPKPGSDATSVDAIGTAGGAGVAGGAAGCGDTGATTGEAGAG